MKILVIADIDELGTSVAGEADLLISCGDVCDNVILAAAKAYNCKKIFAVKGNHDMQNPFLHPIIDLHLHVEKLQGLSFSGFNGCWKYKPRGHFLYEQDEVSSKLAGFPSVDIFVAHNSPEGIHDKDDDVHVGFDAFNKYIDEHRPKLLLHGHQHVNTETIIANTKILGVFGHVELNIN